MEYLDPVSLRHMPRNELLALYQRIAGQLAAMPEGTPERTTAFVNLANIRWALHDPACRPR